MLRVGGGKDKGTRFLNFVDAISGFRHLLTQEDIDKAASMCQGLKGHPIMMILLPAIYDRRAFIGKISL